MYTELTENEQAVWNGDNYPAGQWTVDAVTFLGLQKVQRELETLGTATFTVCGAETPQTLVLRGAYRTGTVTVEDLEQFPEPRKGPTPKVSIHDMVHAVKCYAFSRSQVGAAQTFVAQIRDGALYMARTAA